MTETPRTPVLVDCDTGVDDAMALLYLLHRDDIEVVGVTSIFGNNTAARCAHNTLRVLASTESGRSGRELTEEELSYVP